MLISMKRLLINLTDDEHEVLKKDAYESDISMSELLKGSYFSYNFQGKTPKSATQIVIETPKETFKVPDKGFNICKHGARIGLCKFGCK
jgi:hypothetical protein